MKRAGHDGVPSRPCELFNLVVETSKGGSLALLLGRFGMSVDNATEAFINIQKTVFRGDSLKLR